MRQIGNLPDESSALRFRDYLYAKGIENDVEPSKDGSWTLWVHADDKIKTAAKHLEEYRKNPDLPEYIEYARLADIKRQEKTKKDKEFQSKVYDRDRIFAWYNTQIAPLTGMLIAISVAVYIYQYFHQDDFLGQLLSIARYDEHADLTTPLSEVARGELWRLVTPIFLHFGILHVLFNMMWLKDLGTVIEKRHNSLFLGMLVLSIAIGSNAAQYFWRGPAFGGMSGVVYGLFGYIWMQSKFNPLSGLFINKTIVTNMIVWFFVCFTGLVGPIANACHAIGLAIGMAIGYSAAYLSNRR